MPNLHVLYAASTPPPQQKDRLDSCSLFYTVSLWVQEKTEGLSPPSKGIARGGGEGPVTPI